MSNMEAKLDRVKMSKRAIRSHRLFKAIHDKHCTHEGGMQPDASYTGRAWRKAQCKCGAVSFILGPLDSNFEGYLPQSYFGTTKWEDIALRQMVCDCCGERITAAVNEPTRLCHACGTLNDTTKVTSKRGIRGAGFEEKPTMYYRTGRGQ